MKKVFSLASVTLTINTGRGDQITIGGGGKLLGSVGYSYDSSSMFDISTTADGGAAVSFNKSLAGTISITFKQTAPTIDELVKYILWCRNNPENAEATVKCIDNSGNINFTATGVFPKSIPQNTVSDSAGDRTFDFAACEIIPEEAV
jgi:hypothetical protein